MKEDLLQNEGGGAGPNADAPIEVDAIQADAAEEDAAEEDVEVEAPSSGFQAFLQHASLHNLLQLESLSRTTGVFLVASKGRSGYLHLDHGELIHAECGALSGEAAAAEILAWGDGHFKSCSRTLSPVVTIRAPLQALLLRLAAATDEAAEAERRDGRARAEEGGHPPVPAVEEDKPTEPHLPAPQGALDGSRQSSPPPPRSSRIPPPLPPRIEREESRLAEVMISASGDIVQSRGSGAEEFSARVAYAARLADLIGRAIRSGTPRGLELRGKSTQSMVKWQPDGALVATLELLQSGKR